MTSGHIIYFEHSRILYNAVSRQQEGRQSILHFLFHILGMLTRRPYWKFYFQVQIFCTEASFYRLHPPSTRSPGLSTLYWKSIYTNYKVLIHNKKKGTSQANIFIGDSKLNSYKIFKKPGILRSIILIPEFCFKNGGRFKRAYLLRIGSHNPSQWATKHSSFLIPHSRGPSGFLLNYPWPKVPLWRIQWMDWGDAHTGRQRKYADTSAQNQSKYKYKCREEAQKEDLYLQQNI